MQRRLGFWAVFGVLAAGCTSLLGDFNLGAGPTGKAGDGGGNDGSGNQRDGSIEASGTHNDGGTADSSAPESGADSPGTLTCGFIQTSFRQVIDNSADASTPYQGLAIFTTSNSSSARVVPFLSNGGPPLVYSFRTDQAGSPSFTTIPGSYLQQIIHNKTSPTSPTVDFLVDFSVYSLPDNQTNPSFQNTGIPIIPSNRPIPCCGQPIFTALGPTDYFMAYLRNPSSQNFIYLARGSDMDAGSLFSICPSSGCSTPLPGNDMPPYATGSYVYAFAAGNQFPSSNPLVEYQWPVTADDAGTTRENIGAGIHPIAITSVGGGNVQIIAATGAIDDAGILEFTLYAGGLPESNLFTFTLSDLNTVGSSNDLDKTPVGQKAGFVSYPGHFAILGPGSLVTSTGLNFLLVDVATGQPQVFIGGTGQNFLQGNNRIKNIAMDFAPTPLAPIAFDIAWIEQIMPDGGSSSYDAIFYEKLQCDRH
jgi:hypothetical protein